MSTKWLVIWLIGIFILFIVTGYLFIALKKEEKKVKPSNQKTGFNYQVDPISAAVFRKTTDEDGKPALGITFTGPPTSPLYNQNVIATVSCSPSLSNLVFLHPEKPLEDPKREEIVTTGIDVYQNAKRDDIIDAFCQNEYCYEIGGACTLKRYVHGEV